MDTFELATCVIIIILLWDKYVGWPPARSATNTQPAQQLARSANPQITLQSKPRIMPGVTHNDKIRPASTMRRSGLTKKPSPEETKRLAQQSISFQELFNQSQMSKAKQVMPWLDPVVYEDLRMLNAQGLFTVDQIEGIIAKS